MYKRLIKDASFYSLSTVLARGIQIFTVPIYTRILSPADYGALDLLSYTAVLATLLVGAALDQGVARFYLDAKDDLERKRIASTVLFYNIFIFVLFIPFVGPVAGRLAHGWLDDQVDRATIVIVFIYVWVNAIFYITNNQLKYLFLAKQSALCNIGATVISLTCGFAFVVLFRWGVFGVFLGQICGQGLFALVSMYYARESYALAYNWRTLKTMLIYSLPLVPGTLAFYLMQYVDRYAINQISGLKEVGLYGVGARLASLVNLFLMGFQGAWSPVVMKSFRETDAVERFRVVLNYYLFVVFTLLVGLSLFGREILLLLTTKAFSEGFVVVPLLVLAAILASVGGYFTFGIQIAQKSNYRMLLNFAALALNVVLNYILIPWLGIIGAALATALSLALMTIVGMAISQRLYYVPYKWTNITAAAVLAIGVSNSITLIYLKISIWTIAAKILVAIAVVMGLSRLLDISLNRIFRKRITSQVTSGLD